MKRTYLGQLFERLKKGTPGFFQKLVWLGGVLVTIGAGLTAITMPPEWKWLTDLNDNLICVGAIMALVAKAVVKPEHTEEVKYKDPE